MHARFHSPVVGRFLSVDPVLGRFQQPQSWNRYSYVLGNPLKYVDPSGRYVVTCAAGDKACNDDAAAFEAARQENLKIKDQAVRQAALAYGDPGQVNGTTLAFGDPGKSADGATQPYVQGQSDGSVSLVASVTIRAGIRGTELRAALAHEGSHLRDAQAFVATFTLNAESWDRSLNLTTFATEMKAYHLTQSILAGAGEKRRIGCVGCILGAGLRPAEVDQAIKRILADPNGTYRVTPEAPGVLQFPEWQ